jgi:hypothetical protein
MTDGYAFIKTATREGTKGTEFVALIVDRSHLDPGTTVESLRGAFAAAARQPDAAGKGGPRLRNAMTLNLTEVRELREKCEGAGMGGSVTELDRAIECVTAKMEGRPVPPLKKMAAAAAGGHM